MKKWQKQWLDELDNRVKPLSSEVADAPIMLSTNEQKAKTSKSTKRGIFGAITGALALGLACVMCILLIPGGASATPSYTFALEINPKAVFSVDTDGKITSAVALNEYADTILSNEIAFNAIIGANANDGAQIFVDYAAKLGYLDLSANGAIKLTSTDENKVEEIGGKIENYFKGKGSLVAVVKDNATVEQMCEVIGIDDIVTDAKNIAQKVNDFKPLFGDRKVENKSNEEIEQFFDEKVTEFLQDEQTLATIKTAVENAVTAFKAVVGNNEMFAPIVADLDALVADFTVENLLNTLKNPQIADIFKSAGIKFAQVPQTEEEFKQFHKDMAREEFDKREQEHRDRYQDENRPPINDEDYENHIQDIIGEHGSLEEFWQNRNNPPAPPAPAPDGEDD